jgi:hypothetical protein
MNRALDWPRTSYLPLTRRMLYQMSYKGKETNRCRSKIRTCTYVIQSHASCRLDDPALSRPSTGRVRYGRRDLNSHELVLTRF